MDLLNEIEIGADFTNSASVLRDLKAMLVKDDKRFGKVIVHKHFSGFVIILDETTKIKDLWTFENIYRKDPPKEFNVPLLEAVKIILSENKKQGA